MDEVDLAAIRRTYTRGELTEDTVSELTEDTVAANPVEQLREWLNQAHAAGVPEPNAMCLCTVAQNKPSARIVLLRGLDERGLVFFTSYFSRKGKELAENPNAAATFYWPQLERQVRIEGRVHRIPEAESDVYFNGRPRGHQIGAWASEQSETVENREMLDQRMRDYEERFEGQPVPRPHSWGGYALAPERFEFWQGRPNRLHDRLQFRTVPGGWVLERLQP
ncbi:MAG TPA: pyridoxamine 5'-phosphate oxidase [Candidatus Baltobacteraceae bacterium]|jgi:pyridoxamine 5'-phosphate oxidase|nr:pyridoxamine 5'-phosphate oxidase [Candidatus Baltobacteraceae bacterium]